MSDSSPCVLVFYPLLKMLVIEFQILFLSIFWQQLKCQWGISDTLVTTPEHKAHLPNAQFRHPTRTTHYTKHVQQTPTSQTLILREDTGDTGHLRISWPRQYPFSSSSKAFLSSSTSSSKSSSSNPSGHLVRLALRRCHPYLPVRWPGWLI